MKDYAKNGLRTLLLLVNTGMVSADSVSAAQITFDEGPFDPRRIGLPASTKAGADLLISQYTQVIDEGLKNMRQVKEMNHRDAERLLANYEETIAAQVAQIARLAGISEATAIPTGIQIAAQGRASDVPRLQAILTVLLSVARTNQLLGRDADAAAQWQGVLDIFRTFTSTFVRTCFDQSFPVELALGLERQQQLLGTGVDVRPCANRRFTAEARRGDGDTWRVAHCGLIGADGDWELVIDGPWSRGGGTARVDGDGNGALEFQQAGRVGTSRGRVELRAVFREEKFGDYVLSIPDKVRVRVTEMTVLFDGKRLAVPGIPSAWSELQLTMDDRPCRPNPAAL